MENTEDISTPLSDKHKRIVNNSEDRMKILRGESSGKSSRSRRRRQKTKETPKASLEEVGQVLEETKDLKEGSVAEQKVEEAKEPEKSTQKEIEQNKKEEKEQKTSKASVSATVGIPDKRVIKSRRKKKVSADKEDDIHVNETEEGYPGSESLGIQIRQHWSPVAWWQWFLIFLTACMIEGSILHHTPPLERGISNFVSTSVPSSLVSFHSSSSSSWWIWWTSKSSQEQGQLWTQLSSSSLQPDEEQLQVFSDYFLEPHIDRFVSDDETKDIDYVDSSAFRYVHTLFFTPFLSLPLFTTLIYTLSHSLASITHPKAYILHQQSLKLQTISSSSNSSISTLFQVLPTFILQLIQLPSQLIGCGLLLVLHLIALPWIYQFMLTIGTWVINNVQERIGH